MQSLLNYANPQWADNVKKRTNITVREAVTDLVARMGTQLADAPEVRADLHYTAGEIHRTHGDYRSLKGSLSAIARSTIVMSMVNITLRLCVAF